MDDQNPNEQRPGIPAWVWILALFAIILGLQFFLNNGRIGSQDETSLQEMATMIEQGKVEDIVISGDRMQLTLEDGTNVTVTNPRVTV